MALERNTLYGLLVLIFSREPTLELLGKIREPAFHLTLAELGVVLEGDFLTSPKDVLLEELVVEYTRLFIGPGKHISPHESVYVGIDHPSGSTGGMGLLFGEATVQVQRLINDWGYSYAADFQGIPDHIGIELQLMFLLTAGESKAWSAGEVQAACEFLKKERRFLAEHMVRWVPAFCALVEKDAQWRFYVGMARITREFIVSEYEEVGELLTGCPV